MTGQEILAQAIEHVPALLLVYGTIYLAYWLLGMVRWPRMADREAVLDRFGSIEPSSLDPTKMSALMLVSLLSLFLELLLIRWVASEIRVFAYFKSLVLIACFLGFGLGCYLTARRIRIIRTLAPLVVLVFLVELPWAPLRRLVTNLSAFIGWFSDVFMWSQAHFAGNPAWGVISAAIAVSIIVPLFGLVAIAFVPFGQLVGWYLEKSGRGITAYSFNVFASIVGIWLYTALCFLSTPPVIWFAAVGVGLVLYFWRWPAIRNSTGAAFAIIVGLFVLGSYKPHWWGEESWKGSLKEEYSLAAGRPRTLWSPYQKLTLVPLDDSLGPVRYIINTNDSWYQQMMDLSPAGIARNPKLYADPDTPVEFHQYNLPYRFYGGPPARVLIAGGGSGNDAASAVRNGASKVTVVEIDPLIYRLGRELHFEKPYQSDRVQVKVDDARSFIENSRDTFDLIVFSILDAHTTSSYYTNIRIDNYVYTIEAMQAARRHLAPDGLFVMSFSSERPWFTKRLADVVTAAFGRPPLMVEGPVSFFVVGPGDRTERSLAANAGLREYVAAHANPRLAEASVITDDWPYLYQQHRGIPVIIWILSIGLILVCWQAFRSLKETRGGLQWHFFFLGAAFMLLEVQVISKVALLFGTTWLVNSIVICTLLLFILFANFVAARFPQLPRAVAFTGLFVTLALGYLIPTHQLFLESWMARGGVAMALYCSPVFFAGLIFIASFRQIGFQAEALGSNLLGALVGGLLESASFAIGINALVLLAAALYFGAMLTLRGIGATKGQGEVPVPGAS